MSKLTFMAGVEGDDQIGREMICIDLRGTVPVGYPAARSTTLVRSSASLPV